MRMLVTGGAGFLGSHLTEALLKRGHTVDILDLPEQIKAGKIAHLESDENLNIYPGNVLDKDLIDKLVWQCDKVFHFAAVVGVSHYVVNPHVVLDVNVNSVQLILNLALKYKKKVIFASTSEIYGKSTKIPFTEDGDRVLGPTSIDRWSYSTSKAFGEQLCFGLRHLGLRFAILRFFNAYGPGLDSIESGRVLSLFIGKCLKGEPLIIHGSGKQTRCFTYVSDTVEGIIKASEVPAAEGEVFNIGTDVETTIIELAEKTCEIFGVKNNIIFQDHDEEYGQSYEDIPRRIPCTEKSKRILDFEAKIPLEDGLRITIDAFKKEWAGKKAKD
jgi:UDP-glucose 4-epimerase